MGPQFGYLFPVGNMQEYLNLKAYDEFDAANRPSGWNTWLTFSISQEPPAITVTPTRHMVTNIKRGFSSACHCAGLEDGAPDRYYCGCGAARLSTPIPVVQCRQKLRMGG